MATTESTNLLREWFPWTTAPFICSAPMRTVSGPSLAAAVSNAGGLGFLGTGYDTEELDTTLAATQELLHPASLRTTSPPVPLPIGVGLLLFRAALAPALAALRACPPCALWLFAPSSPAQLSVWTLALRTTVPSCKLFIQVASIAEAAAALDDGRADVLVAQGVADAGGHGAQHGSSIVALVPEIVALVERRGMQGRIAVVAAGGVVNGAGVAAALCLGADGVAMGTRFVAASESDAPEGLRSVVVAATDGGVRTVRTRIYDDLRGTGFWPQSYGGRAIVNRSWEEHVQGRDVGELRDEYDRAVKSGDWSRLTAYAGTAVGSVNEVLSAADIIVNTQESARTILKARMAKL